MKNQKGFSPIIAVVIIGLVVIATVGVVVYLQYSAPEEQPEQTACAQDAKQCPDGSAVGRTGPTCQFAKCPEVQDQTANWKTYTNTEYGFEIRHPIDLSFTGEIKPNADLWQNTLVYQDSPILTISITTVGSEEINEIDYKQVGADINIGGINGKLIKSTGPSEQCEASIIERDGLAYLFDNCQENKTLFNQILSTFKFIEQ